MKRRYTVSHNNPPTHLPIAQTNRRGGAAITNASKLQRLSVPTRRHDSVGPQRVMIDTQSPPPIPAATPSLHQRDERSDGRMSLLARPPGSTAHQTATAQPTKQHIDPRAFKEPEYQKKAIRNIIKYLSETGFGTVPVSTIRGLGFRNFQQIFKHLHLHLVPGYQYVRRKFEDEYIDVLRSLRYPLAESLSPKGLYSIGAPHSTPMFIALLSWMVDLCKMVDELMTDASDEDDKNEHADMNRLFNDYAIATYNRFMDGEDEYPDVDKKLHDIFDDFNKRYREEIARLKNEGEKLEQQLTQTEERHASMKALEGRRQEMEKDMAKFKEYCEDKKRRISKYEDLNEKLVQSIKQKEQELATAQEAYQKITTKLKENNISKEDIDQLSSEQLRLEKEVLEETIAEYNRLAVDLGLVPSNAANAGGKDLRIIFNPTGKTPAELIPLDMALVLIPRLKQLRQKYSDMADLADAQLREIQQLLIETNAQIPEKQERVQRLKEELEQKTAEYEQKHEAMARDMDRLNREMEQKLQAAKTKRQDAKMALILLKTKEHDLRNELNMTSLQAAERRHQMVEELSTLCKAANEMLISHEAKTEELGKIINDSRIEELFGQQ
ncbi:HEC/Ndc80p family-domain-containing protein [Dichotomocladium elegans]|nr:HEC/Ndc80p family-domain-containing protein [Dichotomocladium elegans]